MIAQEQYTQLSYFTDFQLYVYTNNPVIEPVYYYDCAIDLDTEPEYHHYHCMREECQYCQLIDSELNPHRTNYTAWRTLEDFISYEFFLECSPIDEDGYQTKVKVWQLHHSYYQNDEDEEDESEDDDYCNYDFSHIQFGYDPVSCVVDIDCFSFNKLDTTKLHIVGAGAYGVVVSDGKFAIKIGKISYTDIDEIQNASKLGFAPPVYHFEQHAIVPNSIAEILLTQDIWSYGSIERPTKYMQADYDTDNTTINYYTADIAVLGVAEPYKSTQDRFTEDKEYVIACKLRDVCKEHKIKWYDCHAYNMGWYNGGLVVLDF